MSFKKFWFKKMIEDPIHKERLKERVLTLSIERQMVVDGWNQAYKSVKCKIKTIINEARIEQGAKPYKESDLDELSLEDLNKVCINVINDLEKFKNEL